MAKTLLVHPFHTWHRGLSLLLVAALLSGAILGPLPAQGQGILTTIGDFLSLGANTIREIQEAIQLAGQEVRDTLEQLQNDLASMLQQLEQTYQDNLNITINSLDTATRNKLMELQSFITQINDTLQDDIRLVSTEAQNVIREAANQVRRVTNDLKQSLEEVIVVGGETVAFVLDKAFYNGLLIIALVLLGIGLLIFVWLLFSKRLPEGGLSRGLVLLFMGLYVLVFGAIVLVPQARAFVMTQTGIGLRERLDKIVSQPTLLQIVPDSILAGTTQEVDVWGSNLTPDGVSPTATIAGISVPVSAASRDRVVLNVAGLSAPDGSTNLVLTYPERDPLTGVVRVIRPTPIPQPPDLDVTGFSLSPSPTTARANTAASITVLNRGQTEARNFIVQWQPISGQSGTFQQTSVASLAPGASRAFTFNFSYPNAGTFDSVAVVDSLGTVSESNEANNSRTFRITVQAAPPRQARVTVTFTQITVHDDADPLSNGELWLDFNVGGQIGRFPNSGTVDVNSGDTRSINRSFTVTLNEGQDLTVFVNGTDEDSPGFPAFDDHDPMGVVDRRFGSASNWGEGSHSDRSTCPDGCYTIHYTITKVFLN